MDNMNIYFDNSATTPCRRDVADLMYKISVEEYGNPSSMYHLGVVAENHIKTAREQIAATLKVKPECIYFTSGGTESDNTAIIGAATAHKRKGDHIITTSVEHPAVLRTMSYLEKQGFKVTYLGVSEKGCISLEELSDGIREDTILVSIMHTNNEVGSLMPIKEAGELIKKKAPNALFHVDAVQGYGKDLIYPEKLGIDLLSASAHKIHGPKGMGFLYKNKNARILPIIYGGGQQNDLRPGTENVAGIAGLGLAAKSIYEGLNEKRESLYDLKNYIIGQLREMPDIVVNSPVGEGSAPHIANVSFLGVRSEVMLHALEDKGIYVSAGSACASNKRDSFSDTLKAMGLSKERMDSAIRISLSELNTREEADRFLSVVSELFPVLKKYR